MAELCGIRVGMTVVGNLMSCGDDRAYGRVMALRVPTAHEEGRGDPVPVKQVEDERDSNTGGPYAPCDKTPGR